MEETEIKLSLENLSKEEREQLMQLVEKANKPKPGRWKPNRGELYYHILSNGEVNTCRWDDYSTEKERFAIGNVFKTKKEAEFAVEKRKVEVELQDIADELNEGWVPNWNDKGTNKYIIAYNADNGRVEATLSRYIKIRGACFKTEDIANEAIRRVGKGCITKYYLEV